MMKQSNKHKPQQSSMQQEYIDQDIAKSKINLETAKLYWQGLERFFAQGRVVLVDHKLDLVEVAWQVHQDNVDKISKWRDEKLIDQVATEKAKIFADDNIIFWAVVVRPWILIQQFEDDNQKEDDNQP